VKDGVPLKFRVYWFGTRRPLAEVLQAQWTKIGAEIEVQGAADYGFYQAKRAQNDWEVFVEGWGTFGEPAAILSRHVAPDGDLNYMRFRDPDVEALLAGFAGLADPEARRQQALKINERHAELVPFVPLHASVGATALSRRVRNFVPNPFVVDQAIHPDLWVAA
jgi:ABC-type transport system substrate-binding protein